MSVPIQPYQQNHQHHHHTTVQQKSSRFRNAKVETAGYAINFPIQPVRTPIPESQRQLMPSNEDIVMKKYATSVDERNFLTVYEYMVNNQWVIWDYYTGYVHLTGLWKAIGNSKADIVKLVDNSPDLEPVIRRVRGGFLKIQGTWLPFPVARALASRTCYHIRYALIPIFGEEFPDSCLTPGQPGFGQLQLRLTDPSKKRKKRANSLSERKVQHQHRRNSSTSSTSSTSSSRHHARSNSSSILNAVAARQQQMYRRSVASAAIRTPPVDNDCVIESYSSSEEEYFTRSKKRSRANTMPRGTTISTGGLISPPPLPDKVTVARRLSESPQEFLEVLQATRSLQQFSAGNMGRRWSFDQASYGGGFECGGKLWQWDGKTELNVVGYAGNIGGQQQRDRKEALKEEECEPPLSPSSVGSSRVCNTASPQTPPSANLATAVAVSTSLPTTPRFVPTDVKTTTNNEFASPSSHKPQQRSVMDINGLLT